jgi:hypothetical protein
MYCVIKNKVALEFAGDNLTIFNAEAHVIPAVDTWYTAPVDMQLCIVYPLEPDQNIELKFGDRFYVTSDGLGFMIDRWADRFPNNDSVDDED